MENTENTQPAVERQCMDVDIVCVGFGPATGGFLTTLDKALASGNGAPELQSAVMPGMPLQVICYERADDTSFGVSGVVTKGRSIKKSFKELDASQIPMACPVKKEKVAYLLDPIGASRRPLGLKIADKVLRGFSKIIPVCKHDAFELPYIPPFLQKHNGLLLSIGQFNSWVSSQLMAAGQVQVWPGMPVSEPLVDGDKITGIRLVDQGTDKSGAPEAGFMPGMDIKARLTVVGDGPVGAVGQKLNETFGMPENNHQRDWAIGMKMVVELPENTPLEAGTVFHSFGYPEPEIFGFMYVYPNRLASLGIFVPSWFQSPVRTAYRYLQHWMMHPYFKRYLEGASLHSWGAKSLQESGKRGEPRLVGDGFARIGEGSGTTNVLTGSGVDEAWESGVLLAEGVIDLLKRQEPFTKENLHKAYVERRKGSWLEKEAKIAERSRDGFQKGFLTGMVGMGITGMTGGLLNVNAESKHSYEHVQSLEEYFKGRIPADELQKIVAECKARNTSLHDALMDRVGWPKIEFDGKLLVSHQDALLLGGKVQAPGSYADHVKFLHPEICLNCNEKVCIEGCSGQAITAGENGGVPAFDREKCVYCGACLWNCSKKNPDDAEKGNISFSTGAGGLHSSVN